MAPSTMGAMNPAHRVTAADMAALPFSAAAERNASPILAALATRLGDSANVLELASGTGQHAAHFAVAQPGWRWQPTEAQAAALASIDARCAGLPAVKPALRLDVMEAVWPLAAAGFDAVYCANLLHISPWATTAALMHGASRCLRADGLLVVYGPFVVTGQPLAPSNAAFDADLQARNGAWGLRALHEVAQTALAQGLVLDECLAMPANNLLLVLRRSGAIR